MRLDGFQLLGESNARGSTQHVVRKNKGDCHFSEQFKGFSTRGRSENRISCPLKYSLADPQIGFVVLTFKVMIRDRPSWEAITPPVRASFWACVHKQVC